MQIINNVEDLEKVLSDCREVFVRLYLTNELLSFGDSTNWNIKQPCYHLYMWICEKDNNGKQKYHFQVDTEESKDVYFKIIRNIYAD